MFVDLQANEISNANYIMIHNLVVFLILYMR